MLRVKLDFRKKCFKSIKLCADMVADIVFPKHCIVCEKTIPATQKLCVCEKCRPDVPGMKHVFADENTGCKEIISALRYDGKIREAMLRFKFKGIKYLGYTFGKILSDSVRDRSFLENDIVVTAVPIHVYRDRDYNQAEVIAHHLCEELDLTYYGNIIYKINPIERISGMVNYDKEFFVKKAFMFNPAVNLTGKTVVVVDDVYTTGATMRIVAEGLRMLGAESVYALTACYSKTE